jgi:hypothetical protein
MVAVPATVAEVVLMPVTIPAPVPTEAVPGAELVHAPPAGEELRVVVSPRQTAAVPIIGTGDALSVIVLIAMQEEGNV